MIRKAFVVLGIGALVTGLTPTAQAQSPRSSSSENSGVTVSGSSLRTVESRSLADYNRTLLNGAPQGGQTNSGTNIGRLTQSRKTSPVSDVLSDKVDVVFGDTLNSQTPLNSFPSTGDAGDSGRVKLQLQLNR